MRKPCGTHLYIDYDSSREDDLQATLLTAPAFLKTSVALSPGASAAAVTTHGQSSVSSTAATAASNTIRTSRISRPVSSQSSTSFAGASTIARPGATLYSSLRLYLCVKSGQEHKFPSIDIRPHTTDRDFFLDLKRKYQHARGRLRHCFSVWRYAHCQFFEVGHQTLSEFVSHQLTIQVPQVSLWQWAANKDRLPRSAIW